MSPADREEFRLENATNPLFDMWLPFEEAFADRAIDRRALSDEAAAEHAAFAYLLRCVPRRRQLRRAADRITRSARSPEEGHHDDV